MATPRENLLKVFRHERPDWVPVTGPCDPCSQPNREGMDPGLAAALGEVQWGDTATVTSSRALGLDIMDGFGMPVVRISRQNAAIGQTVEGGSTTRTTEGPTGRRCCRGRGAAPRRGRVPAGPR